MSCENFKYWSTPRSSSRWDAQEAYCVRAGTRDGGGSDDVRARAVALGANGGVLVTAADFECQAFEEKP